MTNVQDRVARTFKNVFPNLQEADIPRASTASVSAWDSIAHVTLLSAIADEFGVSLEMEDFEELTSFGLIVDRLENPSQHA
jgi:acyl carrier protein